MLFAIFILSLLCNFSISTKINRGYEPAFKLRVTRIGLNYANQVASDILNQEIRKLRIKNVENDGVKASNIHVKNFLAPTYSYSLSPPSTLSWGFTGANIELGANIHGCKTVVFKVCKALDVIASAGGVSIRVAARFGQKANSTGHPSVTSANCQARIERLDLKVRGGLVGWLINLFRNRLARQMKPKVEKALCKQAKQFMLKRVNEKLASFPIQTNVGRLFSLDYGLVSDLFITSDHIEVALKGITPFL